MDGICPTVAKAAVDGFDLDELQSHMFACEQCRPILDAMTTALQGIFDRDLAGAEDDLEMAGVLMGDVPSMETLANWEDDGGCEATDGCWVEVDGVCPHGRPSWALVMGLV
ncbi:MAG: hypothetical protein WA089_00305 [Anaerolineae bacterium]